jgi:hypothetical protein
MNNKYENIDNNGIIQALENILINPNIRIPGYPDTASTDNVRTDTESTDIRIPGYPDIVSTAVYDQFIFGYLDSRKWKRFLNQYKVTYIFKNSFRRITVTNKNPN